MDTMFNIVICDDDENFLKLINKKTVKIMNEYKFDFNIHLCTNGKELIDHCKNNRVDIVLSDIDMPGINGFESIKSLQQEIPELKLVFITSHYELAYQAYEYKPYSFVFKSDLGRFDKVLSSLLFEISEKWDSNSIIKLELNELVSIDIRDVIYFDSEKNYVSAHCHKGHDYSFRATIKELYKHIKGKYFILVQRGYIVNCRFVRQINNSYILLNDGKKISVTRDAVKLEEAKSIFAEYVRGIAI
jgi:DNA-binding LytR/AlgR family response regulator